MCEYARGQSRRFVKPSPQVLTLVRLQPRTPIEMHEKEGRIVTKSKTGGYKSQLKRALENVNWELVRIEEELEWFATEHWVFRSRCKAFGAEIIISFMVHPENYGYIYPDGKPRKLMITSINAAPKKPKDRYETNVFTILDMGVGSFDKSLNAFVDDINEFRNEQHMAAKREG